MNSWQICSQKLWEAGELDREQEELSDGKWGCNGGQYVWTSGVIRRTGEIKKRNPLEALDQEAQDVAVELSGRVVTEAEVGVGQDVSGDRQDEEDGSVGHVELVEGATLKKRKLHFSKGADVEWTHLSREIRNLQASTESTVAGKLVRLMEWLNKNGATKRVNLDLPGCRKVEISALATKQDGARTAENPHLKNKPKFEKLIVSMLTL